jgi:hypothetical protein
MASGRLRGSETADDQPKRLVIEVVGTGVDPVTFRLSGSSDLSGVDGVDEVSVGRPA